MMNRYARLLDTLADAIVRQSSDFESPAPFGPRDYAAAGLLGGIDIGITFALTAPQAARHLAAWYGDEVELADPGAVAEKAEVLRSLRRLVDGDA